MSHFVIKHNTNILEYFDGLVTCNARRSLGSSCGLCGIKPKLGVEGGHETDFFVSWSISGMWRADRLRVMAAARQCLCSHGFRCLSAVNPPPPSPMPGKAPGQHRGAVYNQKSSDTTEHHHSLIITWLLASFRRSYTREGLWTQTLIAQREIESNLSMWGKYLDSLTDGYLTDFIFIELCWWSVCLILNKGLIKLDGHLNMNEDV